MITDALKADHKQSNEVLKNPIQLKLSEENGIQRSNIIEYILDNEYSGVKGFFSSLENARLSDNK